MRMLRHSTISAASPATGAEAAPMSGIACRPPHRRICHSLDRAQHDALENPFLAVASLSAMASRYCRKRATLRLFAVPTRSSWPGLRSGCRPARGGSPGRGWSGPTQPHQMHILAPRSRRARPDACRPYTRPRRARRCARTGPRAKCGIGTTTPGPSKAIPERVPPAHARRRAHPKLNLPPPAATPPAPDRAWKRRWVLRSQDPA